MTARLLYVQLVVQQRKCMTVILALMDWIVACAYRLQSFQTKTPSSAHVQKCDRTPRSSPEQPALVQS